jgi:hypothetical protein
MKKVLLSLILLIGLNYSAAAGPAPGPIMAGWFIKFGTWIVENIEESHCDRMNYYLLQMYPGSKPSCHHRKNHVAGIDGATWNPPGR